MTTSVRSESEANAESVSVSAAVPDETGNTCPTSNSRRISSILARSAWSAENAPAIPNHRSRQPQETDAGGRVRPIFVMQYARTVPADVRRVNQVRAFGAVRERELDRRPASS